MNYTRQVAGNKVTEKIDGIEAEDLYLGVGNTAGSAFPSITLGSTPYYDLSGGSIAGLVATSIETSYEDRDINTPRKVVRYSASRGAGGGPGSNIKDLAAQKYDIGTEVIAIEYDSKNPTGWTWKSDGVTPVSQPIHRLIPIGHFTLPVVKTTESDADAWFDTFLTLVGKINSAQFTQPVVKKLPVGSVLLTGATGGTRRNSQGNTEWAWEVNYSYRLINTAGFADTGTIGMWNYLFRKNYTSNGGWDAPQVTTGSYMYSASSIAAII